MRISIIGAGAMGGAIARGLLKGNTFGKTDITVTAKTQATLDKFADMGIKTTTDNRSATKDADIVVIAVKPWLVESVLNEIKDVTDYKKQTFIMVAAGLSSEQINRWLKKDNDTLPPLFLTIPNTAIEVRSSMTFIVPINASSADTTLVTNIFNELGATMVVEEKDLEGGMLLASCGIAYAMRYVRAASEGGVEIGFKADKAKEIVLQTVKGAAELLLSNGNHPEAEIDKVTTAGGITIKGLNEMEHAGFTSAVIRGLKAGMKK